MTPHLPSTRSLLGSKKIPTYGLGTLGIHYFILALYHFTTSELDIHVLVIAHVMTTRGHLHQLTPGTRVYWWISFSVDLCSVLVVHILTTYVYGIHTMYSIQLIQYILHILHNTSQSGHLIRQGWWFAVVGWLGSTIWGG